MAESHLRDLAGIERCSSLRALGFERTSVDDLTPRRDLRSLLDSPLHHPLTFGGCAAAQSDPDINAISRIDDPKQRVRHLLAYLNRPWTARDLLVPRDTAQYSMWTRLVGNRQLSRNENIV